MKKIVQKLFYYPVCGFTKNYPAEIIGMAMVESSDEKLYPSFKLLHPDGTESFAFMKYRCHLISEEDVQAGKIPENTD